MAAVALDVHLKDGCVMDEAVDRVAVLAAGMRPTAAQRH
jgi:hypothetical protein